MRPSGWVAVWACYCSDAADDPATLPAACPGHGTRLMCPPVENTRPGPTATGHRCNGRPCPTRHLHLVTDRRAELAAARERTTSETEPTEPKEGDL